MSTIQIDITLAGFLASAAATVSLAEPLVPLLGFLDGAAEAVAVVLVTALRTNACQLLAVIMRTSLKEGRQPDAPSSADVTRPHAMSPPSVNPPHGERETG